jgi:4-amino-4-deoxy-L-arabinose transferase-like glycosyltransferase
MLGRLILLLLQIAIGWFGTNAIMNYIKFGQFRLFIFAIVAAIVVFLVGIIAAQVLREVGQPSSHTLSWAVVVALIAAALWTFGPTYLAAVPWNRVQAEYAVLAGAILGYMIKR